MKRRVRASRSPWRYAPHPDESTHQSSPSPPTNNYAPYPPTKQRRRNLLSRTATPLTCLRSVSGEAPSRIRRQRRIHHTQPRMHTLNRLRQLASTRILHHKTAAPASGRQDKARRTHARTAKSSQSAYAPSPDSSAPASRGAHDRLSHQQSTGHLHVQRHHHVGFNRATAQHHHRYRRTHNLRSPQAAEAARASRMSADRQRAEHESWEPHGNERAAGTAGALGATYHHS